VFRLEELGWNQFFAKQFSKNEQGDLGPARIAEENREIYKVFSEQGEACAELAGKLRHEAKSRSDLPAVGDWVLVSQLLNSNPRAGDRATIHRVLPRSSKFSRKTAGTRIDEQIVAANIDNLLIVASFQHELNPRRIERYLSLAWESGAAPIVVLNKSDLCEASPLQQTQSEFAVLGARVLTTSAFRGDGIAELREIAATGTSALLGSSGVGKSSLINALLGEARLDTRDVRAADGKGRHTTTTRQMILLPGGGILIDTPGMLELQLWDASQAWRTHSRTSTLSRKNADSAIAATPTNRAAQSVLPPSKARWPRNDWPTITSWKGKNASSRPSRTLPFVRNKPRP